MRPLTENVCIVTVFIPEDVKAVSGNHSSLVPSTQNCNFYIQLVKGGSLNEVEPIFTGI